MIWKLLKMFHLSQLRSSPYWGRVANRSHPRFADCYQAKKATIIRTKLKYSTSMDNFSKLLCKMIYTINNKYLIKCLYIFNEELSKKKKLPTVSSVEKPRLNAKTKPCNIIIIIIIDKICVDLSLGQHVVHPFSVWLSSFFITDWQIIWKY